MSVIQAKNVSGGTLPISQLSVPDAQILDTQIIALTDWNTVAEIQNDAQLLVYIQAGDIILIVDGIEQTITQAESVLTTTVTNQTTPFTVQKGSVGTITIGQVVYVSGYDVTADVTEAELADASGAGTMPAVGIAQVFITDTVSGAVVTRGQLVGMDTSTPGWAVGDDLYVSETPGALTTTKPTGTALIQKVAQVVRVHATLGVLQVFGAGRTNDVPNLPAGKFWLGNGSAVATPVSMSGDATMDNAGVVTITGGSSHTIEDEGTPLTARAALNFIGSGVTVTDNPGTNASDVTIDGGVQANLPSVQACRTTDYTITNAWTDVPMDTTPTETDASVVEHNNTNTERIDIKETGLYQLAYNLTIDVEDNGQFFFRIFKNGTTEVACSLSTLWEVSSQQSDYWPVSNSLPVMLTTGDYITLQVIGPAGVSTSHLENSRVNFSATRLQGTKGDTGAQGPPGTGVPAGGSTGQVLEKVSGTDYDTQWATPATGAQSTTLASWVLVSGDLYRQDYTHNLGTQNLAVLITDTATAKVVRPEDVEFMDDNTIRVFVRGNSHSLKVVVVTGRGPAGPTGPAANITLRQGHTWAISGEVKVPSGDTDFVIPFFVSLAAGQTCKVVKARHKINSGTSVTCKVQKNDVDVTGFIGISVTTTSGNTDPADVVVNNDDKLALVVTGVSGTPKNLTFTLFLEHVA